MKRKLNDERGAVAVLVTLMIVVLMTMVALSVDVGGAMLRRREMVNGADAAALAAALTYVKDGRPVLGADVKGVADQQFRLNSPGSVTNNPGGIISTITLEPGSTPFKGSLTVTYQTLQPMYFAPAFGFSSTAQVGTTAAASWRGTGVEAPQVVIPVGYGATSHDKVYICKYVGTPGVDERLQTGQNPILVRYQAALMGNGGWFQDAQRWSFIITVHPTPGPGPEPAPVCPESEPHVWLSN